MSNWKKLTLSAGILAGLALLLTGAGLPRAQSGEEAGDAGAALPLLTVYKTPACGCCTLWVEHLEDGGLEVEVVTVEATHAVRAELGVPHKLASCHTAAAGDYWIEGHVPSDLVERLLRERPEHIRGIAVPGMPPGSPGMEMPNPVTYQVLSVDDQGQVDVFATRQGRAPD